MLTNRIHLPSTQEPEDILSSSLAVIFPDDICNQHGDAGIPIIYRSPLLGDTTLTVADPKGEDERKLFSHFLWNAGVQLGVLLEGDGEGIGENDVMKGEEKAGARVGKEEEEGDREYDVKGLKVLEVGAGTGLAGIIAALRGADECVITDYPAPEVLANLRTNVERNIDPKRQSGEKIGAVQVQGHEWGVLGSEFAEHGRGRFDRLLVADCLWMPWQHENLRRSIAWFLKEGGKAWVVAGFHTGREKMRGFFDEEALRRVGLCVERIGERDAEGREREWCEDRGREDVSERKRWLVVATLRRIADGGN